MRWEKTLPAALALVFAGTHASAHAVATRDAQVEVRTFAFSPDTLKVEAGTRIRWTNRDAIEHTVTWGMPGEPDERLASAALDSAGATHTATPHNEGRYRYFCGRHQFMRGVVIVTSPGERTND